MRKFVEPRPYLIRWVDSCSLFGDRWVSLEELEDDSAVCETLGWVVAESDGSVFVASSLSPEEIGSVMQIPKVAVVGRWLVSWEEAA